jgi:hypothetical protein
MFAGRAFKVLACRALEPALAGFAPATNHAGYAQVPATPRTWTPGDRLVAYVSGLRVVHQVPLCLESIYVRLAPKAVQYCSLQNGPRSSAAQGKSAAIGTDGKSIDLEHFTAGGHRASAQQGQRTSDLGA